MRHGGNARRPAAGGGVVSGVEASLAPMQFVAIPDADRPGVRAFYFWDQDPPEVHRHVAWCWARGGKVCDIPACPRAHGGYCLECHTIASGALAIARQELGVSGG